MSLLAHADEVGIEGGRHGLLEAELVYTPQEAWQALSHDDVTLDYPNLVPIDHRPGRVKGQGSRLW